MSVAYLEAKPHCPGGGLKMVGTPFAMPPHSQGSVTANWVRPRCALGRGRALRSSGDMEQWPLSPVLEQLWFQQRRTHSSDWLEGLVPGGPDTIVPKPAWKFSGPTALL